MSQSNLRPSRGDLWDKYSYNPFLERFIAATPHAILTTWWFLRGCKAGGPFKEWRSTTLTATHSTNAGTTYGR
jgi:hypothetical protein